MGFYMVRFYVEGVRDNPKHQLSIPKPTRKPETTLNAKLVSHNIGSLRSYCDGDVVIAVNCT